MARLVRCSLIQASNAVPPERPLEEVKRAMLEKHEGYIAQAAAAGSQITCLQEIFYGPYFCAEQQTRWYDSTERIPDGPTIQRMRELARQHRMALVVPIYEIEQEGVYYNTAAGLSEHLWKLEQPAHAVANGYFAGAISRVGTEAPV